MKYRYPLLIILALASAVAAPAQDTAGQAASASQEALRVYVDCGYCDFDFLRTEVNFISYVRNRQDAQVHILVTVQETGGGGGRFTLDFLGQKDFAGIGDTLHYVSGRNDSEDQVRRGLARVIKLGLMRFVAATSLAERIQISLAPPGAGAQQKASATPVVDAWDFWVFRSRVNGYFSGERQQRFSNVFGSISANRTTADWKINLSLNGSENRSEFEVSDTQTVVSTSYSYGMNALAVRSVAPHVSAGVQASASAASFVNQDLAVRVAPAFEYNFFPYAQSTRRQFTLLYAPGVARVRYEEETIFKKMKETLFTESLTASLDLKQPWGSISTSLEGSHYFHDLKKYRLVLFSNADLKLVKGLSLNLFASTAYIRDQLFLPRRGASEEDILLRRRQLATSYRYFGSIGLSYSFGSIFNNVVNTRMDRL